MLYLCCLYALLGSEDYREREYAGRGIVRLVDGWPHLYGPRLAELAARPVSPEVAFRVRRPLAVYANWRANNYVPKSVPVWPVCDCYPVPGPFGLDVRDRSAVARGTWAGASSGPGWTAWRAGTEQMARGMIRQGESPETVDSLLRRMWVLEKEAGSDCGKRDVLESWTEWRGGYPEPPDPSTGGEREFQPER